MANAPVRVGYRRGDGIVFYVDGSGRHGLIVQLTELMSGDYPKVPEQPGPLDAQGFTDWYVPSLDEWAAIYQARRQLDWAIQRERGVPLGKSANFYWSSTAISYGNRGVHNRWGFSPTSAERSEMYLGSHLEGVRLIRAF